MTTFLNNPTTMKNGQAIVLLGASGFAIGSLLARMATALGL